MKALFDEAKRYIPGRREQPGAGVQGGGRHAGLPAERPGAAGPRRRGAGVHRLRGLLGPADRRPRPPAGGRRACRSRPPWAPPSERPASSRPSWRGMICERVPACERVRFVSSGTEATMSAIRLARGATGRDEIVKIEGCYHGHVDSLLVQAGSGRDDAGHSRQSGRARRPGGADPRRAVQRRRGGASGCCDERGEQDRLRHPRADRRQHGRRSARAGLPARRSAS